MAKNNFSLDFKDFLDYAYKIDELGGTDALKKATENAMKASKFEAEINIGKALKSSPYSFKAGEKYSKGRVRKSLIETSQMPVEWNGDVCTAYIGIDTAKAPEIIYAMSGTPHRTGDGNLKSAIKVKGKYRKRIDAIQKAEFDMVLNEVMSND